MIAKSNFLPHIVYPCSLNACPLNACLLKPFFLPACLLCACHLIAVYLTIFPPGFDLAVILGGGCW